MVRKILNEAAKKLTNSPTPLLDARVLLSKAINCENSLLVFRDLTKSEITTFNEYIEKRMQGIPVSYITGEKEFMGLNFTLNNSTLIPRPDTECLVEKVIELNSFSAPQILDLCTGSGAIAIAVAKELDIDIEHFQSNYEGDIVTKIQKAYRVYDGIIINPAAYTHTSVAILDALKAVSIPTVEVHISDVCKREDFRQISYVREYCVKTIAGQGTDGYLQAIDYLMEKSGESI